MARFTTPNTNVSFSTNLEPPFQLGATNQSLNLAGQRIFPRVDSGGTGVSELRNKSFLYAIADIVVYDGELGEITTDGGTVEVTSPMTISATNGTLTISPDFIIDDDTYSTITLKCTPEYGYIFVAWVNQIGDVISTQATATISLSNSTLFNATLISAEIFPSGI